MNRLTYYDNGKWRMVINEVEHSGPKIDYIAAMENLIESTDMAVKNDKYGITCESEGEDED